MINAQFPLLSMMLWLPLLGAFIVGLSNNDRRARILAVIFAGLECLITLGIFIDFDGLQGAEFQFVERYAWIPGMHIEFLVGIDGISVLFLPMTALLTLLSIIAGWNSIKTLPRLYFALLLALESATLGIFSALDMMLFFLFWELTLPPLFFLISLWGIGAQRRSAAMKYTLSMLASGVPLLFAILILALKHGPVTGNDTAQTMLFDFPVLLNTELPAPWQPWVFGLLLLGFAIKAPIVPLHTWLPTVALEGPAQITALLTGLKLGLYGIIRFAVPFAPTAAAQYLELLSILGAITLLYAALIALHQTNFRRLLAFASISHVGLVMMGLASGNLQGIQGALLQLFNFTCIASALMLISSFIQQRLGTTEAIHLGGLAKVMPRLTSVYFVLMLASIGMPGTSGFPAELLLILGTLFNNPALGIIALIGAILNAAYMLSFTRRAFLGPVVHAPVAKTQDLLPRELAVLALPTLLVIAVGLCPRLILDTTQHAAEAWLRHINPHTNAIKSPLGE